VDRLIRLSNALLFLSRSDQNQLAFEPAPLNLGELLDVIVEQLRPLAEEKGLVMEGNIPSDLHAYGTDHLTRLFLNLLDNAVKYTPVGGQIKIGAFSNAARMEIVIHNTGPGISPEHLSSLFERFYRVDADRSSETGGTGLGLAIAQEITRLHGGEISVESEAGEGVKFTVYLPTQL
jgi:signal transduction histidine kinase